MGDMAFRGKIHIHRAPSHDGKLHGIAEFTGLAKPQSSKKKSEK